MKAIIIVNGYPRAGKDTFIDYCESYFYQLPFRANFFFERHSTVDTVKDIAKKMGWNGEKTPEMRNMLSELKDLYTKYFNGPLNEIKDAMNYGLAIDVVLFTCMREPEEIRKAVHWAEENGIKWFTVLVVNPNKEENYHMSHSDAQVLEFNYSHVIMNDGDLGDLADKALTFSENVIKVCNFK